MSAPATAEILSVSPPATSPRRAQDLWRGLARVGESRPATVGVLIILFWLAVAALAPLLAPYPPNASDLAALAHPTPSRAHWLGTDHLGRDLLSRLAWGARPVLVIAPLAVLGATALGCLLGLAAGYHRRWIDLVLTRACDIVLVEILPNARGPLIVDMCLRTGYNIIIIGVLGFLGIGLPPPDPDWGGMVKDTYGMMMVWPHMALFPCAAISSLVVGFNLLAVGLRELGLRD